MSLKSRYLATAAIGALLAVGASGTAQATPAYAYASLGFTKFTLSGIFNAQGQAATGVTNLNTNVTMTDSANYPGFGGASQSTGGNIISGADVLQSTSGAGPFPGQNVFTQALLGSSGTRGDGLITGPLAGGASSNLVAEGNLTQGLSFAGSSAGSSTTVSATFGATSALTVALSATALSTLAASVGTTGDSANAQTSASYTIKDLTTGTFVSICDATVTPNVCSTNPIAPTAANQNLAVNNAGPASSQTVTAAYDYTAQLVAGDRYQLTLQDSATEILSTVPEPGSLAVIGVGLMALARVGRQRRKA